MTSSLSFKSLIKFLNNYHDGLQIITSPIYENEHCNVYRIKKTSPDGDTYTSRLLYVKPKPTNEAILKAYVIANKEPNAKIIKAESVKRKIYDTLEVEENIIFTPATYLESLISREMKTYSEKLRELTTKNYIEPNVSKQKHSINDVYKSLAKNAGELSVILASPGQGKSYFTRHLATRLAENFSLSTNRRGSIPLYIFSSQWKNILGDDLKIVEKTLLSSLSYFNAKIHWAEGCEEAFLKIALQANIFYIIFDGFDEYVLMNNNTISVTDVLKSLANLASLTGARIIITSRTTFWSTAINESIIKDIKCPLNIYEMGPFHIDQVEKYFSMKLSGDHNTRNAMDLYSNLYANFEEKNTDNNHQNNSTNNISIDNPIGKGVTISLLADLFRDENNDINHEILLEGKSYIEWILYKLCEREYKRQLIEINPDHQLNIFKNFAELVVTCKDEGKTRKDLLSQALINQGIPSKQVDSFIGINHKSIGKLSSHPIVYLKDHKKDCWVFRQEQIKYNLIASQVFDHYQNKDFSKIESILNGSISFSSLKASNIALALLEQLCSRMKVYAVINEIKTFTSSVLHRQNNQKLSHNPETSSISLFVTSLALHTAVKFRPSIQTTNFEDRTNLFVDLISGGKVIDGLYFNTDISHFNFKGHSFQNCYFTHTSFMSCSFDEQTFFYDCNFKNIQINKSESFRLCDFIECTIDAETQYIINALKIDLDGMAYTRDMLDQEIKLLAEEFIYKGALAMDSVQKSEIDKSHVGKSKYYKNIFDKFCSHIIIKKYKNSEELAVIRDDARGDFNFFAENNILKGKFTDIKHELLYELGIK